MRNIDWTAKHPTWKPNTFHSCILLPAGAIHNLSSTGQPEKSPFENASSTCHKTHGIFVPSDLKVEQMTTLMKVKREASDRKSRTLRGYKKLPFYDFFPYHCPKCELQRFWLILIQDVVGRLIIWLADDRVEERQEGLFPSTSDEAQLLYKENEINYHNSSLTQRSQCVTNYKCFWLHCIPGIEI